MAFLGRSHRVGNSRIRPFFAILAASFALVSCGPASDGKRYVKECILPADQLGSLQGKWKTPGVPIAFQAGAFSTDEMSAIVSAAKTWNGFSQASLGYDLIDFGDAGSP